MVLADLWFLVNVVYSVGLMMDDLANGVIICPLLALKEVFC